MKIQYQTIIIAATACLLLAGCTENKEEKNRLEGDIFRLRKEVGATSEQLRKTTVELEVEKASRQRADEEVKATRAKMEETRKQLDATRLDLENYRRDFQLQSRVRAVGQKLPELATTDGKVFREVVIRAVLSDTLHITHADGSAKLPIASLGEKWLKRFNVSPTPPVCVIDDATLKAACEDAFKAK